MADQTDRIRAHFDQRAKPLSRIAIAYRRLLARYFKLLIPAESRVLEVGCGSGELLKEIPATRKVGIDISENQIEAAKTTVPEAELITIDGQKYTPGETFDYIVISDTVNLVNDVQGLLANLHHCSTSESRLLINIPNTLWRPLFNLAVGLGLRDKQPNNSWLSGQDVQNLLTLADWEVIKSQPRAIFPYAGGWLERLINRWIAPLLPWFCLTQFIIARPSPPRADLSSSDPKNTPAEKLLSVTVVVPARNEAGNIEAAITRTPLMGAWTEFIFIEGGSSDHTWEEIQRVQKAYPEHTIRIMQQTQRGKGNAVREAFAKAEGDLLMILDADLTMPPEELPKYYRALSEGHCEFANGCRLVYPMDDEAMRFLNMIANKAFGIIFSWLLGQPIKDTLCGTKVLTRKNYERIAANRAYFGEFDPYGDFDLLFGADRLNLKIRDIPIRYRDRTYGTTNINRWTGGVLLLRMVIFAARKLKFV
ncbi:MAG: bifunctional class I SAM-dependent methyltransferase/glycosyltransferase family 2 protein [Synoicihabitans sp.]